MPLSDLSAICRIETSKELTKKYSTDASIFEVSPQAVAFPKNEDELKALVKYVSDHSPEFTLSPRAAGTCMSGGSLTEGIMVDMTEGFVGVGEIDGGKKQVWVSAGTYYRDLEKKTREYGLIFPAYTSSKDLCAVGGMVGNNASGEKSLRYGATVDNTLAVRMVCSDGNAYEFGEVTAVELEEKKKLETFEGHVYRELSTLIENNTELLSAGKPKVRKNAAGYGIWNVENLQGSGERQTFNIAKLIVGSQGTLGIVTEVLWQLVDVPEHTRMIVLPISDLTSLAKAVQEIRAHNPEGMETYDHHTYDLAKVYMKEIAEDARRADGLHLVLFAQFAEDSQEKTDTLAHACIADMKAKGFDAVFVEDSREQEAHWAIRRASFKLLKDYSHGSSRAVPFIEDTIVSIDRYGEFLEKLEKILADYNMTYTFAGHIGDGSIRLIPLIDLEKPDAAHSILDLARRTYELVVSFGGSISVDHNDGIIRTPFLSLMFSQGVLELFQKTKDIFDPHHIFNPGKKLGGSMSYTEAHISRTNKATF